MTYIHEKHDIGILRTDGTTKVGLMLQQEKGVPRYEVYDDEFLASQQYETAGYNALPPEKQILIQQQDWRSGYGREFEGSLTPSHYFAAYGGVDARYKDMLIMSYKPTAVTKPTHTTPTVVNGDMELTTSWDGDGARSDEQSNGGTYSWKLTADGNQEATQEIAIPTVIPGVEYTLSCYIYAGDGSPGKVGLSDGVTATVWSGTHNAGSWAEKTVTLKLSPDSTYLKIHLWLQQADPGNGVYFDDATLSHTAIVVGVSSTSRKFNGEEYRSFGSLLTKLNATGDKFDLVADMISDITDLERFSDGFLYIALHDGTVIEDCEDAWNESVDGDVTSTLDTSDFRVGSGSAKFVCAGGLGINDILATEAISSTDMRYHTGVEFWVKSSVALDAGDYKFLLDDTADCASTLEDIDLPALTANSWTYIQLPFNDPSALEAVISLGLKQVVDKGAMTIRLDNIELANHYWYMSAGEELVQSTHASGFAHFFATVQATSPTLWKSTEHNELKSATEPKNTANWSAATVVGDNLHKINSLVVNENDNSLVIAKKDKVYYLDSSGDVQVLIGDMCTISVPGGTTGGKNSFYWQNKMYFPYGTQSLIEYDAGTVTWIDPALYATGLAEFDGEIFGGDGDEQWVFIAVDNSTKVEILATRVESIGGTSTRVWHPIAEITLAGCERLNVSNVFQRRLYISSTSASDSIYYIPLPAGYSDPVNDTNRLFDTSNTGYLLTSKYYANFRNDNKGFISVTAELGHLYDVDIYWECHYMIQGDTAWTDAGDFKGTATNRTHTLYIPDDSGSVHPVSRWIQFKLLPKTDVSTKTPVLLSLNTNARLYPSKRKIISCVVRGVDNPNDKDGTLVNLTAEYIKTVLDEANTATWPLTFYDIDGSTKTVAFLNMRERLTQSPKEPYNLEKAYFLTLQEVALS